MTAITSLETLCTFLNLDLSQQQRLINLPSFPLLLPRRLANKIAKGTLDDPILRQFVPLDEELSSPPEFGPNPVGDREACSTPRLLQKYQGRALLITSAACAMNCRFCFRRSFDYTSGPHFDEELQLIREDLSLKEIILSGGDPLSLSNQQLGRLIESLDQIAHLTRLRFHTRFPVGYPDRLNEGFIELLQKTRLQTWFVLHVNHPKELDDHLLSKLNRLPCPVLTQTVLLKGVNDDSKTLKALFEQLVDHGIQPYYLHQLDRVGGAAHFEVATDQGLQLMKELESQLSGYALPRYVQEVKGAPNKMIISSIHTE